MDDSDETEMLTEEELASATDEELVERIMDLQQNVYACQKQVAKLEKLVYFLLDVEAGIAAETHPDIPAAVDDMEDPNTSTAEKPE